MRSTSARTLSTGTDSTWPRTTFPQRNVHPVELGADLLDAYAGLGVTVDHDSTSRYRPATTWVRNGKPPSETSGRAARPSVRWARVAS